MAVVADGTSSGRTAGASAALRAVLPEVRGAQVALAVVVHVFAFALQTPTSHASCSLLARGARGAAKPVNVAPVALSVVVSIRGKRAPSYRATASYLRTTTLRARRAILPSSFKNSAKIVIAGVAPIIIGVYVVRAWRSPSAVGKASTHAAAVR